MTREFHLMKAMKEYIFLIFLNIDKSKNAN